MPEIAQALASAGRGVAVVTDDPAYGLHPVAIVGEDGPLRIRLHAAWSRTHSQSARSARLAEALRAYCAQPRATTRGGAPADPISA